MTLTEHDIALSHFIDDYEKVRTAGLREIQRQQVLLSHALHAIQHGNKDAAKDLVDRALDDANRAVKALREVPTVPSRTIQTTPPRATSKDAAETAGRPALTPARPGRYYWDRDLTDDEPDTFHGDTARIIDVDAGGVIAYVSHVNAPAICHALCVTPIDN